ncbi:chemotaxis-specific protein-glutamate methyltransferase CheB [uncultured Roseobacter sp.]|uniref:chemotaxis-specific protein-glutamate methyltransferase CheB n=1 Tax=uncultured Roseobacter sp. TaxID=114847 RepID=UPI0026156175|nr:chemotaxis-specific protein-glutamate methyltransferase CheB [uncultured Roseobacter sp.]
MAQENDVTMTHTTDAPIGHDVPKKVLIVDDSRVMRSWLRAVLSADRRLNVVGEACNAIEARDYLKAHAADVLTLDIEMPGMSGLDFLTRLMRARPMPVVMMSSLTAAGSDAAIQALSRGAIDCMVKPSSAYGEELTQDICERVYHAACTRPSQLQMRLKSNAGSAAPEEAVATPASFGVREPCRRGAIILLGASTGGVAALETVLPMLHPDGPPVVVVQHMPGNFLCSFSERLNRQLRQNVYLAREGHALHRGDIVLAPGNGKHTELLRKGGRWFFQFVPNDPPALHCPAVDVLFSSAVPEAKNVSAALLTGLGRDGAEGLLKLSQAGAKTFGQNQDTCVVYGMPRAAKALGAVQEEVSLERIGPVLRDSRIVTRRPHNPSDTVAIR